MVSGRSFSVRIIILISLFLQSCGGGLPTPSKTDDSSTNPESPEIVETSPSYLVFDACSSITSNFECGLWVTDGTESGTSQLKAQSTLFAGPTKFKRWGSKYIFFAMNQNAGGYTLWVTDGTMAGTVSPAPNDVTVYSGDFAFPIDQNRFIFAGETAGEGIEPWISDGTPEGTRLLKNISATTGSSNPKHFVKMGDKVYFTADDGIHGRELWVTDGTSDGTVLLKDINPGGTGSGEVQNLFLIGDKFVFTAHNLQSGDTSGEELWISDGTADGTMLLKNINDDSSGVSHSNPTKYTKFGNKVLFVATSNVGSEFWVTDGSTDGTVMVKDIYPGSGSSDPRNIFVDNGKAYFTADDGQHGFELWITDGTEVGTHLVRNLFPGTTSSNPEYFINLNGKIYFTATDDVHGSELFITDGLEAGTALFKDIDETAGVGGEPFFINKCVG